MGSISRPQSPTGSPSSTIPVVDFSKWNNSTNKDDRLAVARELTSACRKVGFVYIINHGLPSELLSQAFALSRRLFALSHDQKMLAPHPPGPEVHRGYSPPGLEKVSQYMDGDAAVGQRLRDEVRDCKESYEVGSEGNADQPNVWLPEATLPGFRAFTTDFYWACHAVAQSILRAMALGVGLEDEDFFLQFHSGHNNQLRLLHYPPVAAAEIEAGGVARMPAHSDWSTITMLFQDDCGGLEVEDPTMPKKFIPATPVEGAVVVNVGDLLMRWSNDNLKSTLHRVNLPPLSDRFEGTDRTTRARYSIPYFVSADPETMIQCLPACTDEAHPPKYEPVNQLEYHKMRGKLHYQTAAPAAE